MPLRVGTGGSDKAHTEQAISEAVRHAKGRLGEARPSFGFLFASPRHPLDLALRLAREQTSCSQLVGAQTAGEFTDAGVTVGGLALLLVAGELPLLVSEAFEVKQDVEAAATALCRGFEEAERAASSSGAVRPASVLLTDGLNGVGDTLVNELVKRTHVFQTVVGGAAGDDGAFVSTRVGGPTRVDRDGAVVVHLFGTQPLGVGANHGLTPASAKIEVTKASGNVVKTLGGRPAFEFYREHARAAGVTLDPSSAGKYLIENELGVYLFDELQFARAPLGVQSDGALVCAADVPEGAHVRILGGREEGLVSAAEAAAKEARAQLGDAPAAGVLVFDCVCRRMMLESAFAREIAAVKTVFPGVPVAGFCTYGEILRRRGRLSGWHNTTAVVVALPA